MPNYRIDVQYQPFSFQERLAPLMAMKEEYDNMNLALTQLGDEADVLGSTIDPNSRSGRQLAEWNKRLENAASDLSRNGLRATNKTTLMNLRRIYGRDITSISKAAEQLNNLRGNYQKMYMQNPDLMIGGMPTVDELRDNPNAAPHIVNGQSLYNQGLTASKNASARKVMNTAQLNNVLRGYYELVERTGYDSQEVARFLEDASNIPELQRAINEIRTMNQTDRLDNPQAADTYIMRGILDGISYNEKRQYQYDQYGAEMRKNAHDIEMLRLQGKIPPEGQEDRLEKLMSLVNYDTGLKTNNIFSVNERSDSAKWIDKRGKFFELGNDGKYHLTEEGKKEYTQLHKHNSLDPDLNITQRSNLGREIDDYLGIEFNQNETKEQREARFKDVENWYNNFYSTFHDDLYDATRATQYSYTVDSTNQDEWRGILAKLYDSGMNRFVEFDGKSKEYKQKDKIDAKKLADSNTKVLSIDASKYGTVATVQFKNDDKLHKMKIFGDNPIVDRQVSAHLHNIQVQEGRAREFVKNLGINPDQYGAKEVLGMLINAYQAEGNQQFLMWAMQLGQILDTYNNDQNALFGSIAEYARGNKTKPVER